MSAVAVPGGVAIDEMSVRFVGADGVERQDSPASCGALAFEDATSARGPTVGRDETVRLWHVATGRCHCALRMAPPLSGITWHPSATMLSAIGGPDTYFFNYLP
jgi:hypothetical protein